MPSSVCSSPVISTSVSVASASRRRSASEAEAGSPAASSWAESTATPATASASAARPSASMPEVALDERGGAVELAVHRRHTGRDRRDEKCTHDREQGEVEPRPSTANGCRGRGRGSARSHARSAVHAGHHRVRPGVVTAASPSRPRAQSKNPRLGDRGCRHPAPPGSAFGAGILRWRHRFVGPSQIGVAILRTVPRATAVRHPLVT